MPPTRDAILREARAWLGTPYLHQASLRGVGCDCLGLVRGVWRAVLGPEPEAPGPYAPGWAEAAGDDLLTAAAARHLIPLRPDAARPGDVLLFRWRDGAAAKHLGILSGGTPAAGTMIHAHDRASVAEVPLHRAWRARLAGAFAFPGAA